MTRFIGNSFRVTPLLVTCRDPNRKNLETIAKLVEKRRYNLDKPPDVGWVSFASMKDGREYSEKIIIWKLPNDLDILPVAGMVDVFDTKLKKRLPPNIYAELPTRNRYYQIPMDFVFYKKDDKLYTLISSTNERSVNISIKQFLENEPLSDYGFIFQKNPEDFKYGGDLILWLLYRYYEKRGLINGNILIKDCSLLTGMSHTPNIFEYGGRATPTYLDEVKLSIARKRVFDKVMLTLKFKGNLFEFLLHDDGRVEFKASECEYLPGEKDILKKNLGILTYFYTDIIPEIKKAYNNNYEKWVKVREKFRREKFAEIKASHSS